MPPSLQQTATPTASPLPLTPTASAASTPAALPTFAPSGKVADLTVDKLVDKLNSQEMGGIKPGDLFRVTGELAGSDYWTTGASGDYLYLKTSVGSDLIVFIEKSETRGWKDGTNVEMILESVSATINGETTEGWMRARATRVVS